MLAALVSILLVAAPKDDLKELEGHWTAERMEQRGTKFPTDLVLRVRLEVRGDQFTFVNGKSEFTAKVTRHDPAGDPKAIDLTREGDRQTVRGIYRVEGDTLTICTSSRGERPASFSTDDKTPHVLTTYRRADAAKP